MVIVYQGIFLGEGLRLLGHDVRPLRFNGEDSATEQIEAVCAEPDLVLLELWGKTTLPKDLYACRHRLAAYCIDSCINEFWLVELLQVMDDVFVDQPSSVHTLARHDVNAVWLPLCISETDFRTPQAKQHDLTFIGRLSDYRMKRRNLVRHISRHYSLHHLEGVSKAEMLDVFARSKIVLNENFFSGLTLRVLQGLAAGSVVLTEAGGEGVDRYFTHDQHLVCYTPDTILNRIGTILSNYDRFESVALQGQTACRTGHTSRIRAEELLNHIRSDYARTARVHQHTRQYAEARARYLLCLRFGGSFQTSLPTLFTLSHAQDKTGAKAACTLGDIFARADQRERAHHFYAQAVEKGGGVFPKSKIALLLLQDNKPREAKAILTLALASLPEGNGAFFLAELEALPDTCAQTPAFLFLLARVYAILGHVFHLGFLKQTTDNYPDTALELAFLAWKQSRNVAVLDFMLECAARFGIEGELLPELRYAIEHGFAHDRQILRTAELAELYYDKDLALLILAALRKAKKQ